MPSAACGPMAETGFDPRQEAAAPGVVRSQGRLISADGTSLGLRSWVPAEPRAALAVVHGLAEHAQRYGALAVWLAQRGFAVHAVDLRGHGESPGPRVHVDSFQEFVADAAALRAHVAGRHPALPHLLLGHSMGGLVALLSAHANGSGLRGLVLSSPLLGVHPALRPGPVLRLGTRLLLAVAPRLLLPMGPPAAGVSRDPQVVKWYVSDPLVSRRISAGWYAALEAAQATARAAAPGWSVPTLVMAAGEDRLVDASASAAWVSRAPRDVVQARPWPDLYHEIFNEPEREEVYAVLLAFLESRLTGA
jgi:alpha-beta hydrolase superfamily lysophospholipase